MTKRAPSAAASTPGDTGLSDRVALASLPGLAKPALRALHAAGYTHLHQLATAPEIDLLALHGMGPNAIALLRGALHARGKSFARS